MGILIGFVRQFRTWDVASRVSFGIAFILFWVVLALLSFGPDVVRDYALAGVVGLLLAMQLIVLWGNRTMIMPYTKAQRHFMAGDFARARDVLEAEIEHQRQIGKKVDSDTLTLLGNVYRQLGNLTKSQQLLRDALKIGPKSHFSHYGLGRTLLAQGDYIAAANHIEQAVDLGAPPVVIFDLGYVYAHLDEPEKAVTMLQKALQETDEAHRQLMATYLLHQFGAGDAPDHELIAAGLPYWHEEASRFSQTLYGQQVQKAIDELMHG
jgi:tetratricopeptide (TPR) repeat protein